MGFLEFFFFLQVLLCISVVLSKGLEFFTSFSESLVLKHPPEEVHPQGGTGYT